MPGRPTMYLGPAPTQRGGDESEGSPGPSHELSDPLADRYCSRELPGAGGILWARLAQEGSRQEHEVASRRSLACPLEAPLPPPAARA